MSRGVRGFRGQLEGLRVVGTRRGLRAFRHLGVSKYIEDHLYIWGNLNIWRYMDAS